MSWLDEKIKSAKSIAIVGNARGVIDSNGEIDRCDLVFRLNNGIILPADGHRGRRTDFVCTSSIDCLRNAIELEIDCVWMTPKNRESLGYGANVIFYPVELWDQLFLQIGSRPSTGMMAIDFILNKNPTGEIKVFGFNFYKSVNFNGRGKGFSCPHNFLMEEEIVKNLVAKNKIKLIEVLNPAFHKYGFKKLLSFIASLKKAF